MADNEHTQALYNDCTNCGASGEYAPPPVDRGGGSWSQQSPGACPDCKGVGAIPTSEGKKILHLVKRFTRAGRIEIPE
ncbi:hypothetical protein [Sphingomonas sp. PWP1-2]|uniref:hypothetical protein n=1 Tax=Sphingomonas sp. PWP1-2 TaxID=2804558 RepID=UPI003CFA7D17